MSKSPTKRSLDECKRRGWVAQVVEHWVPYTRRRRDLFGCIDIVAIGNGAIIGIQATSGTNHAARIAKANAEPRISAWLGAGAMFEVWSWSRRGPRGKRKTWQLRASGVSRDVSQGGG